MDEYLKEFTVKLYHEGSHQHDGTGFFVAPHLIITCAHVVDKYQDQKIYISWNNQDHDVKIKHCSDNIDKYDLALLELADKTIKTPYLSLQNGFNIGDKLYNFGYPKTTPNGDVGTFEVIGIDGDNLLKFKEGLVSPGLSGSPLLNLQTKKVCALVVISINPDLDLGGRAIPVKTIFEYFPELKQWHTTKQNPFTPLAEPITNSQDLFGREAEINQIFDVLNSGGSVALVGKIRSGKTSILKAVEKLANDKLTRKRKPIYLNLGNVFDDNDFYVALCDQIGITFNYDQPIRGFLFFREISKYRLLLLLDGVEQMTWEGFTSPVRNQLRSLANDTDPPLRLVVAANKPLTELFADSGQDSPFEGICQEIPLKPWDETMIREFIKLRLSETNIQFTQAEIQAIIEESQGHPQKVMQGCFNCYQDHTKNP